ncbi:MAG: type II toxin-antitoxin system VapC family toxin [Proteobacteria bacterium]|nr:type II toxin-antitoxin system VapC family toxin [Pseudomonadota bacterium]
MMCVLDTNVVSELRKVRLGEADPNVAAWSGRVDAADLFVSAITIMELELGVLSMERRDADQGALLRAWLEQQVLPEFSARTLPVDTAVAQRCARLHIPDKRGERDALIAATALVHGMAVVTRNVAGFEPTGVSILNPWQAHGAQAAAKLTR